jgi:NADPH2:quinone reductase
VNYSTENLKDRINELTGGKGADVVYDPVGGPYTEPAVRALAWRGRLLIIGFAAGEIPKIPLNLALLKERSLVGVYWGDSTRHDPAGHLANLQPAQRLVRRRQDPPGRQRTLYPRPRRATHIAAIANRQVKGKIVVAPGT